MSVRLLLLEPSCLYFTDLVRISLYMSMYLSYRYFDKSLQFIIYANGKAGINAEHSCGDATVS